MTTPNDDDATMRRESLVRGALEMRSTMERAGVDPSTRIRVGFDPTEDEVEALAAHGFTVENVMTVDCDMVELRDIQRCGPLGGKPLGSLDTLTRGQRRLIDAGLVELRAHRLRLTREGAKLLREGASEEPGDIDMSEIGGPRTMITGREPDCWEIEYADGVWAGYDNSRARTVSLARALLDDDLDPATGRIRPRYHTYGPPVDVRALRNRVACREPDDRR